MHSFREISEYNVIKQTLTDCLKGLEGSCSLKTDTTILIYPPMACRMTYRERFGDYRPKTEALF
jgi:hypothetical protein